MWLDTGMTKYALTGINNDEHTCTLCGKANLVRVAWLAPLDADGNVEAAPSHYGTDCAALLLTGTKRDAATVNRNAARLELVRSWLRKGHTPASCAAGYTNRTAWSAEVVGDAVRCWTGFGWAVVSK